MIRILIFIRVMMQISKIVLDVCICLIFIGIWTGIHNTYGEPLFTFVHLIFHLQFIQYTFMTTVRLSLNILCISFDKCSNGTLIFYTFYWINHYDLLFLKNYLKAMTLINRNINFNHHPHGPRETKSLNCSILAIVTQLRDCVTITRRQLLCQFIQMVMTKHIKPTKPSLTKNKDKKYSPWAKRIIFCQCKLPFKCAVLQ